MTITDVDEMEVILPITEKQLTLLGWFAEWTPETHKANWTIMRADAPGWREVKTDLKYQQVEVVTDWTRRCVIPVVTTLSGEQRRLTGVMHECRDLLSYGLLEGTYGCYRLTPKGRAALKFYDKRAPEVFKSHCPEIFDDVDLRPITGRSVNLSDLGAHGKSLPDTKTIWRKMLRLYPGGRVHSADRRATLSITPQTGEFYLHGSLRSHHRVLCLSFQNTRGDLVLEAQLSSEQLMDAMTQTRDCSVTLAHYIGSDGMARSEPCPPPVNIGERMAHRIQKSNRTAIVRIHELRKGITDAKMGKRAKEELLSNLEVLENNWPKDSAFAVTQAVEEVSSLMEGAVAIAMEKQIASLEGPTFAEGLLQLKGGESG